MNYSEQSNFTQAETFNFLNNAENGFLMIPSELRQFTNISTKIFLTYSGREKIVFSGILAEPSDERLCQYCQHTMHIHGAFKASLSHLPFGSNLTCVQFRKYRYKCPCCGHTCMQEIPFKAAGHNITIELCQFAMDLLAQGYTNKEVAEITGLGKNTIKAIDLKRLQDKYTIDGTTLKKPERQARFLCIDEFKLHNGHKYATVIIDLETGHILWLARGKKKECVYSFMEYVGQEWMDNVVAVACDMNSDFQEAIEERCKNTKVVFDYFHIVKNFNEKVIGEVRKDEEKRLIAEGRKEEARRFKKSKYLLTSSRETLQKKEIAYKEAQVNKEQEASLFGPLERYNDLIKSNKLLFMCDIIKDKLEAAYRERDITRMKQQIEEIIELCLTTNNRHFIWFANLLDRHLDGIIAHAVYPISSGKVEGINNSIKTLRRSGFGYPDDYYFFLKLFDMSRNKYVRNPKSHKICD